MASYTGDRHGRWDNCRVRIFKLMSDKTLRMLTLMDGLEESIDQRVGEWQAWQSWVVSGGD